MNSKKMMVLSAVAASMVLCSCSAHISFGTDTTSSDGTTTTNAPSNGGVVVDDGESNNNGGSNTVPESNPPVITNDFARTAYDTLGSCDYYTITEEASAPVIQYIDDSNQIPMGTLIYKGVHEKEGTMHHVVDDTWVEGPDGSRDVISDYQMYSDMDGSASVVMYEKEDGVWSSRESLIDYNSGNYYMIFQNSELWDSAVITEVDGGYTAVCTVPNYIVSEKNIAPYFALDVYFQNINLSNMDSAHTTIALFEFDTAGRLTSIKVPDVILEIVYEDYSAVYDFDLNLKVNYDSVTVQVPAEALAR